MGLVSSANGQQDLTASFEIAGSIQDWWNEKQASVYGFQLMLYKASLEDACAMGARLFDSDYFAKPPGPFKRAAAFVVVGRLCPYFDFIPLSPDTAPPLG